MHQHLQRLGSACMHPQGLHQLDMAPAHARRLGGSPAGLPHSSTPAPCRSAFPEMGNYMHVANYVAKAEAALEAAVCACSPAA